MTTTTRPYNSFLDDRQITIFTSSSGKRHVEGWFGQSLCGSFIDRANGWRYSDLTSLCYLGKLASGNASNVWCKRCLNNYRGMNVDA